MTSLSIPSKLFKNVAEGGGTVLSQQNGAAPHFRPEIELLLCCARTSMDAARAQRIRDLVQNPIDWLYLMRTSFAHGVMPLLYKNLSAVCPEEMPESAAAQLRDCFIAHSERNLLLTAELLRLLRLLGDRGIASLPYKGPVLAASVYGDISLRSFSDLDILVNKRDAHTAKRFMLSEGYRFSSPLTERQEAARLRSRNGKDFTFVDSQDLVKVELHWALAGLALFPLDTARLWQRLEKFNLGGTTIHTLEPEDMLLVLSMHGAKHFFRRLEWVCDIAELIRAKPNMNWDRVLDHATRLRTRRILFFGLVLASELLGAELPDDVRAAVQVDTQAASLAARARSQMFIEIDSTSEAVKRHVHRIDLRERGSDRMWLRFYYLMDYLRALVKPNEEDRKRVHLPFFLSFLYILLRPIRLIRVYGGNLLATKRKKREYGMKNCEESDVQKIVQ